jgi:hypothetical protein
MHYFMSPVAYACSYVFIILENSRSSHISLGERDSSTNGLGGWMVRRLGLGAVEKRMDFASSRDLSLSSSPVWFYNGELPKYIYQ